jgi:catechol 2,3-dioxygenase
MSLIPRTLALAHVGLWVFDFDMMVKFYRELFSLAVSDQGQQGTRRYAFMTSTAEAHHQLVIVSGRTVTTPKSPGGLNQVSFRLPTLVDLQQFHRELVLRPVSEVVTLTHGNAWSIYFHDPEHNRIETFVDTPWHMPQPFAQAIDLTKPAREIAEYTELLCRQSPASMPMNEWRDWMQTMLGGSGTRPPEKNDAGV